MERRERLLRLPGGSREVFASYGRYWAESLRLPHMARGEIVAGVRVQGLATLDDALAGGRGAILALPHLGGWDWGGAWLAASGYATTVLVEELRPPDVFDWFARYRRRLGLQVVPVGPGAGPTALRALAANRVLCLLADRVVAGVSATPAQLFGTDVLLPSGPVALSLRSGAPLLPAAVYFGARTGDHLAVIRPPVRIRRAGRFRDDIRAGTALLAAEIEGLITAAPAQWHVVQPPAAGHGPAPA